MHQQIRISAVSYLNTRPFLYGLRKKPVAGIDLALDMPSECARKLLAGEVEIGLIPAAVLPLLENPVILSDYCIGATGPVLSVKLYSAVPLEKIKRVLLDYQSRTSVMLVRILAAESWKIQPEWLPAAAGFEQDIAGDTAGVVIGDRTFALNGKFPYEYDLAESWLQLTGLPFVFAVWAGTGNFSEKFIRDFNASLAFGVSSIDAILAEESFDLPAGLVASYLGKNISYSLDEQKKAGLALFLQKLSRITASDEGAKK
ncbi:MAG: hypothetical protein FD123_676 [Bacteroidetes bacterium]|nr:MAG: hypothetical protein FD123_676 [Bacteroidota bacterium]